MLWGLFGAEVLVFGYRMMVLFSLDIWIQSPIQKQIWNFLRPMLFNYISLGSMDGRCGSNRDYLYIYHAKNAKFSFFQIHSEALHCYNQLQRINLSWSSNGKFDALRFEHEIICDTQIETVVAASLLLLLINCICILILWLIVWIRVLTCFENL